MKKNSLPQTTDTKTHGVFETYDRSFAKEIIQSASQQSYSPKLSKSITKNTQEESEKLEKYILRKLGAVA